MRLQQAKIDVPLAIVSLVLGLGVWLYAVTQQNSKESWAVRVKNIRVSAAPEGMKATKFPLEWMVTFSGTPANIDRLRKLKDLDLSATIDLQRAEIGTGDYRIDVSFPPDLPDVEYDYKRRATVTIDQTSSVPRNVEIQESGELPAGLLYMNAAAEPDQVKLEGTREDLLHVGRVIAQLNVSKVASGSSVRVPVIVLDRDGNAMPESKVVANPSFVTVTPTFSAGKPRRTVFVSPSFSGQPALGFRIARIDVRPSEVTVQGDRKSLANLMMVTTDAVRISGLQKDAVFAPALKLPKGVQLVASKRITVHVVVAPIASENGQPPAGAGGFP